MNSTILIVEDERSIRTALAILLGDKYQVLIAANGKEALAQLQTKVVDLVLLDIGLPDISGLDLLRTIGQESPDTLAIMVTAIGDTKSVVDATKMGAYDYLVKPVDSQALQLTIRNALDHRQLKKRVHLFRQCQEEQQQEIIIGESEAMQHIFQLIDKVSAAIETPVLIDGETGVGKGIIARAIHNRSINNNEPFVMVNCGAISKELVESELFGYDRGAFTGARSGGKIGRFEEAGAGTLFLDEIGVMSLDAQAKLLSVLEERSFYRVGGNRQIKVEARILAATNIDLEEAVAQGAFRQDLYFRLNLITITIPPLQARADDIMPLVEHFLDINNRKFHKQFSAISPEARTALLAHQWPGNIRELRNTIERITLLEDGKTVLLEHLPFASPVPHQEKKSLVVENENSNLDYEAITSNLIREGLRQTKGNVTKAAALLNMPPHKLRYRMKKLDLDN